MQGGQGDFAHPSSPPLSSLPPPSSSSSLSPSATWPTTKGDGAPASSSSNGSRPSTHGREPPSVPLVSGSGARVPTQLLDQHGGFSRPHHQASNGPSLESGPRSSGASGSNAGGASEESNAIDLTNDDQDEFQVVSSKGPDVQRQLNQSAFVDAPVCIGMINSVVLSVFGLPQALVAYPSATSDPKWSPSEWPPNCEYYIEGGYRPIHLAVKPATEPQAKLDVDVFEVISPLESREHAAVHGQPPPNGLKLRPTAFGTLAEKYSRALAPLMLQRLVGIKARCRLVAPNAAQNFLHALELLIFTTRRHLNAVSNILYSENVILETPAQYDASQHAGAPEFFNPHGSFGRSNQAASGGQQTPQPFSFGSRATLMQTKEATEQERKKQVDTVYAALRGGEDLESVEAPKLVTTPLLPHQKQALAFLLDRERFRRFEDAIGKGKGKPDDPVDVTKDDSGIVSLWMPAVRFSKSSGNNVTPKITSFVNVVTRSEQGKRPRICRGAILADDMGLGKTIVTIALIAATLEEARRFGASNPGEEEDNGDEGAEKQEVEGQRSASGIGEENGEVIHVADDSDEDVTVEDFNINVHGAPPPRKKPRKARKPKVSKKAKKKEDAESLRLAQIAIRSRATLLVLPLTLVSNWEGQIKEHWDASKQPSIYLYHGSTRITDPHELAQFDIVMTTYSTLATEFAHQSVWANGDESEDEEVSTPQSETVEDDVLLVDVNGKPLEGKTAAQKAALLRKTQEGGSKTANGSKKGKRKADLSRESENPLQRIEWFRIVLDEAHTIKEAKTLQSRAVCNLVSPRRIALTGTPVQNRIDDLFSLIKFLRLEPFDDRAIWNQFCGAREKPMGSLRVRKSGGEAKNADPLDAMALARVQTIMKFLTLRRTKEAKMADGSRLISLPPKFSRIMRLDFEVREKALYAEMSQRYIDDIKTMKASDTLKNNYATILHEISNLRMTCDHPGLVDAGKDTKRAKGAVEDDPSIAILQDGLSHDRAVKLFDLLCLSDRARCHICDTDQSGFPRGEEGEPKPVLTRCMHLTCSDCLRKSVGAPTFDKPKADDRFACPECGISISPLLDIQQILPGDIEGNEGGADQQHGQSFRSLSLQSSKFGCDRNVPLDDRADLSSKIRALLQELEPFSKCNPNSELYDPTAPVLDQVAVDQSVTEGDEPIKETVQVVSIGSGTSVAPIKSVVFSQWTTMLDRIAKALHRGGIKATYLDGRMRRQERSDNLEKFRLDDSVEVLLVSLKAGGIGLNLVSACRAYLMEPYWNPATENQGLDRVHRMGQTRPVITTKYVMGDSIEERMLELQKYKLRLAEQVGTRRGVDRSERHHEELNILLGINQ